MDFLVIATACGLSWLYVWGTNRLALVPWEKSAEKHWTERAKILYPRSRSAALNVWFVPGNFTLAAWLFLPVPGVTVFLVFVFALAGAQLGSYEYTHTLFPGFTFRRWLRYIIGVLLIRFAFWMLVGLAFMAMPEEFNWLSLGLGLVVVAFLVSLHFGVWLGICRLLGVFTTPPERLRAIVQRASAKTRVPCRGVWLMRAPLGYAAALPASRDLIFSEGLLAGFSDDEIAAICDHELAHLTEPRRVIWSRIIGTLWVVPFIFLRPAMHTFPDLGFIGLFVIALIPMAFARRVARKMEVRADTMAKESQTEAGLYARALERLYQINHSPAVMAGSRQPHPHLYDRLLAAGVTPTYPRPLAPRGYSWNGLITLVIFVLLVVWLLNVKADYLPSALPG